MSEFTVYPAIDLRQGRVVRLRQGRAEMQTTYGDDAAAVARDFEAQGARWLHVVNLDGAFGEISPNLEVLRAVCASVRIPVQFGGGLRTLSDVERAFEHGVQRIVLGTVALREPALVKECVAKHGHRIAVGIDAREGMVAVEGWVKTSSTSALGLAQGMADAGVQRFIYTDIARDGMLVGPDLNLALEIGKTGARVIASGGVGTLEHVRACATVGSAVDGVIIGRALYEGRFTVRQALEQANRTSA